MCVYIHIYIYIYIYMYTHIHIAVVLCMLEHDAYWDLATISTTISSET